MKVYLFEIIIYVTKNTLEILFREQSRLAHVLVIWTDCDREGENIGAEIANVCKQQNSNIEIYRAKFSEITPRAIFSAAHNLIRLDERVVSAVDCRTELDLRIGRLFCFL